MKATVRYMTPMYLMYKINKNKTRDKNEHKNYRSRENKRKIL